VPDTYSRGSSVTFTESFTDQVGNPILPLDSTYPTVQIETPQGVIAASGVGLATSTPGLWQFSYTIQVNAECSEDWKIIWTMTDAQHDSFEKTKAFSVVPLVEEPTELERTGSYLSMLNTAERLIWKGSFNPENILLKFERADGTVLLEVGMDQLETLQQDCYYYYYIDSPNLDTECDHLVTWRYRETAVSQWVYEVQHLKVPYRMFWFVLPYLRNLVDKLNKVTTTPLSYTDGELHKALERGLDLLNSVHPFTSWQWNTVPHGFVSWWVLCGGLWALESRLLLEIEVSHTLTGQTVTLEYDHTSGLESVLSRWNDLIWEKMQPAKLSAYRQSAGPGMVAVRPYRLNYRNRVFRVATSAQPLQDLPGLLNSLGLYG
jgi:hypothetical protein